MAADDRCGIVRARDSLRRAYAIGGARDADSNCVFADGIGSRACDRLTCRSYRPLAARSVRRAALHNVGRGGGIHFGACTVGQEERQEQDESRSAGKCTQLTNLSCVSSHAGFRAVAFSSIGCATAAGLHKPGSAEVRCKAPPSKRQIKSNELLLAHFDLGARSARSADCANGRNG